eukprot:SAG31_NODE_36805_length_310_cov_0.729858_1_plen_63_part_01
MSLATLSDQLIIRLCCHGLSGRDLARLECVALLFSLRSSKLACDGDEVPPSMATMPECAAQML